MSWSKSTSKPSRKRKTEPEKAIQERILKYLETTGLLFWRQNSGMVPVPTGRINRAGKPVFRMIKLGTEGLPDIIAVLPPFGKFVGLEVKSAVGKLRPAQVEFKDRVINAGGMYFVVRSVDDVVKALNVVGYNKLPGDVLW